jgi:predicted  nucleic acid-binding Zn-ribbon protein
LEREVGDLRRREGELSDARDALQAKVADLQRQLQQAQAAGGGAGGAGGGVSSSGEVKRLRDENERLRQELSAFDMDFFEEIENLKYAHAEALKKLRVYEMTASREGREREGWDGREGRDSRGGSRER